MTSALIFAALLLGFVLVVAAMQRRAEQGGKAQAQNDQKGEVLDAIRDHAEIRDDVGRLPADAARNELQQWSRR